ncbi:MAG: site-2 protease family protein [Planctomycetales bacterium]|nr:site-2 protease family protein [Planctomycetales bacterium]
MDPLQLCIAWYLVFVFSTVFHEFAHAFAGYRFGDHTALRHGLVTLNPVPHIQRSPLGMVVVPLLSFIGTQFGWMIGWASTPYDPYWAHRYPKQAALMGLAGPAANLILVIVAGILVHIGISAGIFIAPEKINFTTVVEATSDGLPKAAAVLVSILFTLNVLLCVFNLIPVTPLDGTALMEFILKGNTLHNYRALMAHPTIRAFGIFIAWTVMDFIYGPLHLLALNALYIWRGTTYG